MATTYWILSDFHSIDPKTVAPSIEALKREGAQALVLNGDLFGERSGYHPQEYLFHLLNVAGQSQLPVYVLPGSHEEVHLFELVLTEATKKYSNLVNTFEHPKIELSDHHLVFLQGSDWRAGEAVQHGYSLENGNPSGVYRNQGALIRVINFADLEKLVTQPEKTLIFSHVPRRFESKENGVDVAEFWEAQQNFKIGEQLVEVGSVFPGPAGYRLKNKGAPIALKQENRGNSDLKELFERLGIFKSITGHFHESVGRANDASSNPVEESMFVEQLFYNASYMDRLIAGLVSVEGNKAAYETIDLQKYFK